MARYSKNTSTYIQRKRHQLIDGGSIIERDWNTIGERNVIEPGKRRVYSDSGFLFTESNIPSIKKRNRTEEWSVAYTEDSLSPTINDEVNIIKLPNSQDIRDYAYYGSAVELVRASLENIIKWFPAKAWTDNEYVTRIINGNVTKLFEISDDSHHNYLLNFDVESRINRDPLKGDTYEPNIWLINNPFNFDFFKSGLSFSKYENELRNIPYSWTRYYMKGCKILSYEPWIKPYNPCDEDFTVLYEAKIRWEVAPSVSRYNEFYSDYGVDKDCVDLTDRLPEDECIVLLSSDVPYYEGSIYGIKKGNDVMWCTDIKGFTLMPIPSVINSYFNNLDGFERQLLTKSTAPIYNCILKTPIAKGDNIPGFDIVNREYRFPSRGYCIICDGIEYYSYVNELYNLAEIMDELYTDNIWTNMTHESIRNFDWTYHKDFEDGDDVDNIFGGTRLKDMLRIYGRFFDDIKRYIDNIKLKNCVTFDGIGNLPVAELSDKAQITGWEVYSTKTDNTSNDSITEEFIENNVTKKLSRWEPINIIDDDIDIKCDEQPKWFPGSSPEHITENDVDTYFMRLLTMNGPHIFRRKGTRHAIEMVYSLFGFGETDYTINERFYSVKPIESNKIVYAYRKQYNVMDSEIYTDVSGNGGYISFSDYIHSLNDGVNEYSTPYITLNGEYYELISLTFKELCEYINEHKIFVKNYEDDPFSGTPIKEITLNGVRYIVPYFNQDRIYDGNVQFQTNGGWGKDVYDSIESDREIKYGYMESMPYTPILQNCTSLLSVNKNDIKEKTMYYVTDLTDITEFTEDDTSLMSHYFKIIDPSNPQLFSSWSNVPQYKYDVSYEYDDFCNEVFIPEDGDNMGYPTRPLYYGVTYDDYLLTQYLDSIVMDNLGNNPHTGNGKYDLGFNYYKYINVPFYYSETHYGFDDESVKIMAEMVRFEVDEYEGEKIIINDNTSERYFLPNKLLIIKHNTINMPFLNYFKAVIVKYLTQVIPSTSILIFS